MLSAGQFISSDGHCQSFGEGGDGYIPGEGVGVVVYGPGADDLAAVVDRLSADQVPLRLAWLGDQGVEVLHLPVLVQEGLEPRLPDGAPLPDHFAGGVDAAGATETEILVVRDAEVQHLAIRPEEGPLLSAGVLSLTGDPT